MMPAVPSLRSRTKRWRIATIIAGAVAVIACGVAVGAVSSGGSSKTVSQPAAPVYDVSPPLVSPTPDPAAAKEATCGVLRSQYQGVATAVDEVERFNKLPWSDPNSIRTVNALVDSMTKMTADLEKSLSPSTPEDLRAAVMDYTAGLRAVTISQRDHASNEEINGTGLFYNRVLSAPLRICGIPS
ncbi:hypothetical protein [Mycolicibacterium lutetiense]